MERTGWWFNTVKKIHNLPDKKTLRQKLRHNATPAEKVLWRSLKKSGVGAKFRRQHGVGPYVLDFYCPEHKLAVEIEGSVHDDVIRRDYDGERHAYLESHGIRVLYFKNRELLELSDYVVGVIRSAVLDPPPRPLHYKEASRYFS
jgi:very-short-patch-repair endonuclease